MLRAVHYLVIIWLMVNVMSFALYGYDKRRARKNLWRVRESVLLASAWLMGGVGAWLGMRVFRHKTKHRIFTIMVPIAAVLQLLLMGYAAAKLLGM